MKLAYVILFLNISLASFSQSSNNNYILTRAMLNDAANVYMDKIDYFDGLGRPLQTVEKEKSPTKKDLVTYTEYDIAGRVTKQWLPVSYTGNGSFIALSTVSSAAQTTYGSGEVAYSKPIYEPTPFNRVSKQYGPGASWHTNNKFVANNWLVNATSGVNVCAWYVVTSDDKLQNKGQYPEGKLTVTKITDEDGGESYQYTDLLGHVVLIRQVANSEVFNTYYVYDDLDNLRYVLPPKAADVLTSTAVVWDSSNQTLKDYAYIYRYDKYRRNIEKKLPGADPIYLIYDKSDRLVLTQTGIQRSTNYWTVIKYDKFGRVLYTCEVLESTPFSTLLGWYENWLVVEEFGTPPPLYPMGDTGYTRGFYVTQPIRLLTVNYYDDYRFLDMLPSGVKTELTFSQQTGYSAKNNNVRGQLTGTRVYELGDSTKYTATANYYDTNGRVIQKRSSTHLGGYIKEDISYTFSGKPLSERKVHSKSGVTHTEIYTYLYDHAERLTKVSHSLNGSTPIALSEYVYDEVGRVKTKKLHGGIETTGYLYNIRSWVSQISGARFLQNLYYNTGQGAVCYNGNISSMTWKGGGETTLRGYKFNYDKLNRLINSVYGEEANFATNPNRFTERPTYDKHGNILTMIRYGKQNSGYGLIDSLTLTYNGNQLKKVTDTASDPLYQGAFHFQDGGNVAVEYLYDTNGNMTVDYNKKISKIQYNQLNLPNKLQFNYGHTTSYRYGADGTKRNVTHVTSTTNLLVPMGSIVAVPANQIASTMQTDYCGNLIYENGVLSKILTEEGYITLNGTTPVYHYYLKDHQGNNHVVIDQSGVVEQVNHYYPFGMTYGDGIATSNQPYKYNDKELDRMHGLDWYDYGARFYDPALGRFHSIDPLAADYDNLSPYGYCAGNPIKYIDVNGEFIGTIIGTVVGGVAGAYDSYKKGGDVWAGAAEGAVSGAIAGATVDLAVAATVATGGGALVVIGVGAAAGAVGGAAGAVAGDATGQVVTSLKEGSSFSNAVSNINTTNMADKAKTSAVTGAIGGATGGVIGKGLQAASNSTKAVQGTMSKNITETAKTLTKMGADEKTVGTAVNKITTGMGEAGRNTLNTTIKVAAGSGMATESAIKVSQMIKEERK